MSFAFSPSCPAGTPLLEAGVLDDGGTPQEIGSLSESGSMSGAGLKLEIDLEYRPVLRLDRRPAIGLVVAGSVLALLGLFLAWAAPLRLVWFVIDPVESAGSQVGIYPMEGLAWRPWLPPLVTKLSEVLVNDS